MKKLSVISFYGFLSWLVPFLASFVFYGPKGQLSIDIFLFKGIMHVVGMITACALLVLYFMKVKKNFLKEGVLTAIVWYIMNIGLDVLILLPMAKMTFLTYFTQIGFGYFVIPILCISFGYMLEKKELTF